MGTGGSDDVHARALEDGARRSSEAQRPVPGSPPTEDLPVVPGRATVADSRRAALASFSQFLWRRHKLKIIAVLILLLTELAVLTLGGTLARGPG